jgi:hypothetical protein
MPFRQKVFIGITILSILFCIYSYLSDPGWRIIMPYTLDWNPLYCIPYFLSISIIYGFMTKDKISSWYFWVHALLSLLPLFYNTIRNSLLFNSTQSLDHDFLQGELTISRWLNYIFIGNQLLFVLIVLIKQLSGRNLKVHN